MSDLHLEMGDWGPPSVSADAIVLAGDIHRGTKGVEWAYQHFPGLPVLYVAGNHEYYGTAIPEATERIRGAAAERGLHFLERDALVIGGVRFLGATLWTDFALTGDVDAAARAAFRSMLDYRWIRVNPGYRALRPLDTREWHIDTLEWLADELAESEQPTVVITHHAPSVRSVPPPYENDPLRPAFVSSLDNLITEFEPVLWIHGHTHYCVDYRLGATRILSNQRGCPGEDTGGFAPDLVVSLRYGAVE